MIFYFVKSNNSNSSSNNSSVSVTSQKNSNGSYSLALALQNNSKVKSVDFATVWGQGHITAERTGSGATNFINWVNECLK